MSDLIATILAPLLSVNEPEAQIVEVSVEPGQRISIGDLLCVLGTTKANFDVEAEAPGYIHRILITPGQTVEPGAALFEIGSEPLGKTEGEVPDPVKLACDGVPADLRITQKALNLAREIGFDLNLLPRHALVTETLVRASSIRTKLMAGQPASAARTNGTAVLIYGDGGHAKTIIDLLRQSRHFSLAGVLADPAPVVPDLLGVPVLGTSDVLPSLHEEGLRLIINGVGGTNSPRIRVDIFERLAQFGYAFPTIVHERAVVESSARLAAGVQIFGMAFVGSAATVGFGAIINTGAIVSHDCVIGDYAHLTPGVILAGHVKVGTAALIGMGVTTGVNVTIGDWARIGNGARIHADVPPHTVVQAGTTWPPN